MASPHRKLGVDEDPTIESFVVELQRVNARLRQARLASDDVAISALDARLRDLAQLANDAGASWSDIGGALGIRRGNAYQRYRRRPCPPRTERTEQVGIEYVGLEPTVVSARRARLRAQEVRTRSEELRARSRALREGRPR